MSKYFDVRDLIADAEALEEKAMSLDGLELSADTTEEELVAAGMGCDDAAELVELRELLAELKGNGGDEQWRGDWYPITLIHEDEFENAMDEMLEDIGDMPKNIPAYLTITVNYDALKMDYSAVEYQGSTYLYR